MEGAFKGEGGGLGVRGGGGSAVRRGNTRSRDSIHSNG